MTTHAPNTHTSPNIKNARSLFAKSTQIEFNKNKKSRFQSVLPLTITHLKTQTGAQTLLNLRHSYKHPASQVLLETTPNYNPHNALRRWQHILDDIAIASTHQGHPIKQPHLQLLDNNKIICSKAFNGCAHRTADGNSLPHFLETVRDYMRSQLNRRPTQDLRPRILSSTVIQKPTASQKHFHMR